MSDKKERILEEQKAPLKNTDHAFVRVSKEGTPEMPRPAQEEKIKEKQEPGTSRGNKP